jgi:phosphohistidine phosphatase
MTVYLVRHGAALSEVEDPARPLSHLGRDQVRRVARHAAAAGLRVAEIRHSGLLRARETAELLAAHISPGRGVTATEGLRPGDDPGLAQAAIEAAAQPLMLVGHLPHLGRLASALLAGQPDKAIVGFSEAALACLTKAEGLWLLHWMLTPAVAPAAAPA